MKRDTSPEPEPAPVEPDYRLLSPMMPNWPGAKERPRPPLHVVRETEDDLIKVHCWKCGTLFAFPLALYNVRNTDHEAVYCPFGHTNFWSEGLSREEILTQRLASAEARRTHEIDQRRAAERSNVALKGVITRQKRRAANGVCPCCGRTVSQLARHMKSKHPDFVEDANK